MKTLNISSLIPERDKVDFGNGVVLEFISRREMDPTDIAKTKAIENQIRDAQKMLDEAEDNDGRLAAVNQLNDALGNSLRLIIAGLTDETLAGLKMGLRGEILRWWGEQNKGDLAPKNGAGPDQPQPS